MDLRKLINDEKLEADSLAIAVDIMKKRFGKERELFNNSLSDKILNKINLGDKNED